MRKVANTVRRFLNFQKLIRGIDRIRQAPIEDLRDPDFVAAEVRAVGLQYDLRGSYGTDNAYMNYKADGLWQNPVQFASCLVLLGTQGITSFLEVGTSRGWTASFATAYLLRFEARLKAVTLDLNKRFDFYSRIRNRIPLEYRGRTTSEDLRGSHYDLVFIDADHSFEWVQRDYENVGQMAPCCMFHDINDDFVSNKGGNNGGVRRFWASLKEREPEAEFHEFLQHSCGANFMGIGVRVRKPVGMGAPAPK